jgi:hypothetical protein
LNEFFIFVDKQQADGLLKKGVGRSVTVFEQFKKSSDVADTSA